MLISGAHQTEPPSPLISWVNPFPSRFINRTACFPRKVSYFRESRMSPWKKWSWMKSNSEARPSSSPGNRSNYKSTLERVDSKGLYGRWRLHLMGSWLIFISWLYITELSRAWVHRVKLSKVCYKAVFCVGTHSSSTKGGALRDQQISLKHGPRTAGCPTGTSLHLAPPL